MNKLLEDSKGEAHSQWFNDLPGVILSIGYAGKRASVPVWKSHMVGL